MNHLLSGYIALLKRNVILRKREMSTNFKQRRTDIDTSVQN